MQTERNIYENKQNVTINILQKVKNNITALKDYKPGFCPICHKFGWGTSDICWNCGYEDMYHNSILNISEQYKCNYEKIKNSERGIKTAKEYLGNIGDTVEFKVLLDNIIYSETDFENENVTYYRHRIIDVNYHVIILDNTVAEYNSNDIVKSIIFDCRKNKKEFQTWVE